MTCREHCIGGPWGGHHSMCPDARECVLCEGPVEDDHRVCKVCVMSGAADDTDPYEDEPWDFGLEEDDYGDTE